MTREEVELDKLLPQEVLQARAVAERKRAAAEAAAMRESRRRVGHWLVGSGRTLRNHRRRQALPRVRGTVDGNERVSDSRQDHGHP